MKYGINMMHLKSVHDLIRLCDVSMDKFEVGMIVENAGIIQRSTVVNFVIGDDVVLWVSEGKVPDNPAGTMKFQESVCA